MQFDLLAQLLGFPEDHLSLKSGDPTCDVTRQSCDLPSAPIARPAVVGVQPGQVEPPKDLQITVCADQLVGDTDEVLSTVSLDNIINCDSNELLDLEELLHPFARSIVEPEGESWDIESLFAV